jgi:uncharacterized DUF497 family protein
MFFIWQEHENEEHIAKHGIEINEAEYVARNPKRPYPRRISSEKWLVRGRTLGGRLIQVVYVIRTQEEIDPSLLTLADRVALEQGERAVYVIHARELRHGER